MMENGKPGECKGLECKTEVDYEHDIEDYSEDTSVQPFYESWKDGECEISDEESASTSYRDEFEDNDFAERHPKFCYGDSD